MSNFVIELLVEDQRGNKTSHQLGEGRHTLGQSTDSDIVINDEYTSRYHADLFINKTGVFIIDMNSTNGVYFKGKKIDSILKLEIGQTVIVGKMKLSTRLPGEEKDVKQGRKPSLGQDDDDGPETVMENVDQQVQRILMS